MQLERKKYSLRSQLLSLKDKQEYIQKLSDSTDFVAKSNLTFLHLLIIAAVLGMIFGVVLEINLGVIELTGLIKHFDP